jgi:hypothetical protein
MSGMLERLLAGNFSSPLTLVFILFVLLAFYFLFRLGWFFFVKGEEFTDSAEGKRQTKSLVRLLVICVFIALFSGFAFEFVRAGRDLAQANAPTAAKGFFEWLVGK